MAKNVLKKDGAAHAAALTKYCDLRFKGIGTAEALEQAGVGHVQADLAWYGDTRNPNHVPAKSVPLTMPDADDPQVESKKTRIGLVIAELRIGDHAKFKGQKLSWGQIAVVTGLTESAVRRAFKATGVASEGTRKGRGGRFLNAEPLFYTEARKGIGVESEAPRKLDPRKVAAEAADAKSVLPTATKRLRTQLARKAKGTKVTPKAEANGEA